MDITTEYRSHWVAADGTRHASRWTVDHEKRNDLHPILNLDELHAYADLADSWLPSSPMGSGFWARQILEHGGKMHAHTIAEMCGELTDDIPHYHAAWRAPFVEMRNRWPGVDGKPVVACVDTLPRETT